MNLLTTKQVRRDLLEASNLTESNLRNAGEELREGQFGSDVLGTFRILNRSGAFALHSALF